MKNVSIRPLENATRVGENVKRAPTAARARREEVRKSSRGLDEMLERHKEHFIRHERSRSANRSDSATGARDLQCEFDTNHDREHTPSGLRGKEGHRVHI